MLTALELKTRSVKKKVPQKGDSKQMVDVAVPSRTLKMNVSGNSRDNHDKAVRDFADHLRFSNLLGPRLEEIRVSQEGGKLRGEDVVSYGIDCLFKLGL